MQKKTVQLFFFNVIFQILCADHMTDIITLHACTCVYLYSFCDAEGDYSIVLCAVFQAHIILDHITTDTPTSFALTAPMVEITVLRSMEELIDNGTSLSEKPTM